MIEGFFTSFACIPEYSQTIILGFFSAIFTRICVIPSAIGDRSIEVIAIVLNSIARLAPFRLLECRPTSDQLWCIAMDNSCLNDHDHAFGFCFLFLFSAMSAVDDRRFNHEMWRRPSGIQPYRPLCHWVRLIVTTVCPRCNVCYLSVRQL